MPWETKEKAIFVCAKRFKQMDWVFSKKQLAEKKNTKISAEDRKQDLFKKYLQKQTKKKRMDKLIPLETLKVNTELFKRSKVIMFNH